MPRQGDSPDARLAAFDDLVLAWFHEMAHEVSKFAYALTGVAAQLDVVEAGPLLACIDDLEHRFAQLRETVSPQAGRCASAPWSLPASFEDPELVEILEQLDDAVEGAVGTALGFAAGDVRRDMILERAARVRTTIGA